MLFSFNKLKEMASLPKDIKIDDVTKAINSIGFEVEETHKFGNVSGLKFGKVLETSKNPNGDKLTVCKIKFDDKERIIQTTATNIKAGDVVLAFVPGSKFNDITIKEKELKGIVSEGMLSSLEEIGVSKDLIRDTHGNGIMIYDLDDISINPISYLGLQDIIIDIDILSNRSDAQSYFVMARELAAYFKTEYKWPELKKGDFESNLKVENGDAKHLIMFESNVNNKISIKEQILLAKSGIKSINDIVDLTNLTFIMTGQPTHVYDKAKVGKSFSAKKYSGRFIALGNNQVELKKDLVIQSDDKPVAIAGVIGHNETGVTNKSKEFIFELGVFPINNVRESSKNAKVTNLTSSQSSKIISDGTTNLGLSFLTNRIKKHSKILNNNLNIKDKSIKFNFRYTSQLAGFDITKNQKWNDTLKSLEILGFKFSSNEVTIPSYRHDIKNINDINEEIFRFFGYDSFAPDQPKIKASHIIEFTDYKTIAASQGYQEVNTYSLISKEKNIFNPFDFKEVVTLKTFVSKEREVIRSSQIRSMLEVIEYNQKRKLGDLLLFSEGMIGNGTRSFIIASTIKSFNEMKKDIINFLPNGIVFKVSENKELHPGVSANIYFENKKIGWIGKVHPSLSNIDAFMAEFILSDKKEYIKEIKGYSKEPLKIRDITFELDPKETIDKYIKDIDAYKVKIKDIFKKGNKRKLTISFIGNDKQIEIIDNKYNK